MKFLFKKKTNLLFIILIIFLIHKLFYDIFWIGLDKNSWNITEFLINYHGGFVRRGLIGELIWWIHDIFKISAYYQIIFLSVILFAAFIFIFRKILKNLEIDFYILFSILLLANPILNNFIVRKDLLIVISFFYITKNIISKNTFSQLKGLIIILTSINFHESIFFLIAPLLIIRILFLSQSKNEKLLSIVIFLLPAIFFCTLGLFFKGNKETSQDIWDSWKNVFFPYNGSNSLTPTSAVESLSWTLTEGTRLSISTLLNFKDELYAPLMWCLIIFFIFLSLLNLNNNDKNKFNSQEKYFYILIQFCAVLPLFILGWDYGRWIFYWTSTTIILFYFKPFQKGSEYLIYSRMFFVNNRMQISYNSVLIILFLIGIPLYSWSLSKYLNSSSIIFILKSVSNIIKTCKIWLSDFLIYA